MLYRQFVIALFCGLLTSAQAQQRLNKQQAPYSHYLGVQANPLFNEILSLGSNQVVNNPYLLRYALRDNSINKELSLGLGYSIATTKDENGFETVTNDLNVRAGLAHVIAIGHGLEISIGLDLLYANQDIQTFNIQSFNFNSSIDSTITKSRSTENAFGLGPRLNLSYAITENFIVGTETNYYFNYIIEKTNVESKHYQSGSFGELNLSTNASNFENKKRELFLSLPVALYLTVRF